MNNITKFLSYALIGSISFGLAGCRDDWSQVNTEENALTVATPNQLLTSAEFRMYPNGYTYWFYSAPTYFATTQMLGFTGAYNEGRLTGMSIGSGTPMMMNQLKYFTAMEYELGRLGDEAVPYQAFLEAARVLTIYGGIYDGDTSGDMPYTEGGRAAYGGLLKPSYDRLEDLYNLWDSELKNAVSIFKTAPTAPGNSACDVIYGCDWNKWAKFASSLRVKLATRLIHRDLAKAKSIVAEAYADGVITETEDDVMYFKADSRLSTMGVDIDAGELAYGSGNNSIANWGGAPNARILDWQFKNRDPRVRFTYQKNNWSSKIVDWYLSHGYEKYIQPVIRDRYETKIVKNEETGKDEVRFAKWKDEFGGARWARYVGLPDNYGANTSKDPEMIQYFNYGNSPADKDAPGYALEYNGANYSYRPYSIMSEKMIMTNANYTAPRVPGENATAADNEDDVPRTDMYLTAAEVNFYLAEFAVYGTTGLGSASEYFKKAVTQSVETLDKMARVNDIPYYDNKKYKYSEDDATSIALQEGEIEHLLAQPDFQLTGNKADDLEKIFLNLEIHFMWQPLEHWVTSRRSGIPKFNSNLVARKSYANNGVADDIYGRRANFGAISPTDQMKDIISEVYQRQGFTLNVQELKSGILNKERLWQDVGAPQWGEGPNVGI